MLTRSPLIFAATAWAVLPAAAHAADIIKLPAPAAAFDFARDVRPILETSCVRCHGPDKHKGQFRLDTQSALLKGGDNGKAVSPGKSAESTLIHYVARQVEDMEMPPDNDDALSAAQVAILRAWVDAGAAYPAGAALISRRVEGAGAAANTARLAAMPPPVARKVDFIKDVQPIFQNSCYACHGPKKQEAGFRLDHKPTLMRGGEIGLAVVPGKSSESLLIHFVAGLREEGTMPKDGPRLSAEQIGVLRAWIDQGADFPDSASAVIRDWRDHWSYKPVVRSAIPTVKEARWPRTPIDKFILARLEKEGMAPSPEADKITLLRRVHFDLTGLPPSIKEVDAFVADKSPGAYEKVVEQLLASPHYGERWGRHWLDAARYSDSDGYEKDKSRNMWFYRDWVIGAYNRDLPYNEFVIEQIAGDELPNPTQDQIVATGFLRNSMLNEEGGADPEQFRMDAMFDRMDALGRAVLGLTTGCAQCHTHKYDPITHEEYYRMFAFLNNSHEPIRAVYTPSEAKQRQAVLGKIAAAEARLQQSTPGWQDKMAAWEEKMKTGQPQWQVLQTPFIDDSLDGMKYLPQKDGSFLSLGFTTTKGHPKMQIKTDMKTIGAFQLELLTDPNLVLGGPGRSFKGTCALTEFTVEAAPADNPGKLEKIKFKRASADFEQADAPLEANFFNKSINKRSTGPASYAIDDNDNTAWGIDAGPGRRNVDRKIVFVPERPIANTNGTILKIGLRQFHGGWNSDDHMNNSLGRFRISATPANEVSADPVPRRVRETFGIPRANRTAAQIAGEFSAWRQTQPEWKEANAHIDALWRDYPEGSTSLVLQTREELRETRLLKRGDFMNPGKTVTPGVIAALGPLPPNAPPTRLTLARWLVDRKAPTTPRAYVNRVWQAYFGIGLVATAEDLGMQGEAPSNPELLDWLASEFMDKGWHLKPLQRMIVTSSAYRQSSHITPGKYDRDQYNRLLARGPRVRVEGEIVRDVFLSASGLLNLNMGGRSVMPPAPAFLFLPPVSFGPFNWVDETGPDRYRRGLYTFRRRSTFFPMLGTFDVPTGDASCARRTKSNTPLQALMTLNETISMEAAQALARRMVEEGGRSDNDRVTHGFRRVLSRYPTDIERKELLGLLSRQKARIGEGWVDPWLVASSGERPTNLPAGVSPADLAAYTIVGRVILNLDEAIMKE